MQNYVNLIFHNYCGISYLLIFISNLKKQNLQQIGMYTTIDIDNSVLQ